MKIAVVGASGYAGGELLRLLLGHPNFVISYIAAGANAGEEITAIHPHLSKFAGQFFSETKAAEINKCELVFIALPHGQSAPLIAQIDKKVKIIDLGADFRLTNSDAWEKYYGGDYAGSWLYAIPELPGKAQEIAKADRVSNPGCYATAIALAAAPAILSNLIDGTDIVVVASSGTTGAGRSAKINLSGSEVMNSLTSYKFGGGHQHTPEIEETLTALSPSRSQVKISFTPILAPMPRGILATVTSKIIAGVSYEKIRKAYSDFCQSQPFLTLLPAGIMPKTSSLTGSNGAHLQIALDEHTQRLIVSIAIDNLGKGAAGQAIQSANIMVGLDQSAGLTGIGVGT